MPFQMEDIMNKSAQKTIVLDILNESKQAILDFYKNLTDEEKSRQAELKVWQAKEYVIHGLAWCKQLNQALEDIEAGKKPEIESDYLAFNDQTYINTHQQTWQETLDEVEQVYGQITRIVEDMSEEDLTRTNYHEILRDQSVASQVVGYYFSHQLYHLADYDYQNGRGEKAIELMLQMADRISKFDESPRAKGTSLYNVACFFTLMDQFEEALKYLEMAFPYAPDLKTWAREDTDLIKLHQDERFLALTNPEG
jgi:tetratricopeptide (TPR) repeat protein